MPIFECKICNKQWSSITRLKTHERTHTGEKPFKCDTCYKKFATKSSLKTHLVTHIGGDETFKCDTCQMTFTTKTNLKTHLLVHTSEKYIGCKICNKIFTKKNYLNHLHADESPFRCPICKKTYISRKLHLMTHKEKIIYTGEKPFECDICYRKCLRLGDLKRHLKKHRKEKPFECDLCYKNNVRKAQLTMQTQTNTAVDDRAVIKTGDLKRHSKPYIGDTTQELRFSIKLEPNSDDLNESEVDYKKQSDIKIEEVYIKSEEMHLSEEENSCQ